MNLDVEITASPAELRAAIGHLSVRERAVLHLIHDRAELDLRDQPASEVDGSAVIDQPPSRPSTP